MRALFDTAVADDSIVDALMAKGNPRLVERVAEGRAEGLVEGMAKVLREVLRQRFGPLSDATRARIEAATIEQLDAWTDRALTAATLDEVLAPYPPFIDNLRWGSGNKVLHNVVGGHLGVFEGNGGDLRIGLSMQSLHDGERWVHEPLRLSVFIEAPRAAIDAVLAKHEKVRELVENEWIYLFQIDADARAVHAYRGGAWVSASARELDAGDRRDAPGTTQ